MKTFKILLFLLITVIWSCSKDEVSNREVEDNLTAKEVNNNLSETNRTPEWNEEKETQLQELTSYIGYLMRIPEIRHEVHNYEIDKGSGIRGD